METNVRIEICLSMDDYDLEQDAAFIERMLRQCMLGFAEKPQWMTINIYKEPI